MVTEKRLRVTLCVDCLSCSRTEVSLCRTRARIFPLKRRCPPTKPHGVKSRNHDILIIFLTNTLQPKNMLVALDELQSLAQPNRHIAFKVKCFSNNVCISKLSLRHAAYSVTNLSQLG